MAGQAFFEYNSATMAFTYVFQFNRGEHVRAVRQINKHALRNRWLRGFFKAALWLIGIYLALITVAQWAQGAYLGALTALTPLAFLALIPASTALTAYLSARQWEKLNTSSHTVTFEMDADRVSSSSEIGRTELRWVGVRQVVETSEFVLFYVTDKVAMYLPKRAIPSLDLMNIRHLVREHVAGERLRVLSEPSGVT